MENRPIVLVLKIVASSWGREPDSKEMVRMWQSPPFSKRNTASRVSKRGIWPFARYDWAVWSPFYDEDSGENGEEAVLDGEAANEEAAMGAADEALKKLIAEAETAPAGA